MGMRNVGEWLEACEQALSTAGLHFGHGTDSALDEAAWLLLHVTGDPLDGSFDDWARPVTADDARRIEALLTERIASRRPLAYLLGEAWFCGYRFEVTPDTLVPRSPIAELIQKAYQPWCNPDGLHDILDLCTGGGCIAIATALALPEARVEGADLSPAALDVARRNAQRLGVAGRTKWQLSDGFDALAGRRYDLVVTNPPYVPDARREELPAEYLSEPEMGLFSGSDGLDLPLRILLQCVDHLTDDGILIMEVGESAHCLQEGLPQVPFTWLDFEQGGEGVFMLERNSLKAARPSVRGWLERRGHVG